MIMLTKMRTMIMFERECSSFSKSKRSTKSYDNFHPPSQSIQSDLKAHMSAVNSSTLGVELLEGMCLPEV